MILRSATRTSTSLEQAQKLIILSIKTLLLHLLLSLSALLWICQMFLLLLLLLIGFVIELACPETCFILVNYSLHRSRDALVSLPGSLADFKASKFLKELQTFAILILEVCFELSLLYCILDLFLLLSQLLMPSS